MSLIPVSVFCDVINVLDYLFFMTEVTTLTIRIPWTKRLWLCVGDVEMWKNDMLTVAIFRCHLFKRKRKKYICYSTKGWNNFTSLLKWSNICTLNYLHSTRLIRRLGCPRLFNQSKSNHNRLLIKNTIQLSHPDKIDLNDLLKRQIQSKIIDYTRKWTHKLKIIIKSKWSNQINFWLNQIWRINKKIPLKSNI